MKTEFNNLEQLINRKEEIDSVLHHLTGFFFPRPADIFDLVKFNLIEVKQFDEIFNLLVEKNLIELELGVKLNGYIQNDKK